MNEQNCECACHEPLHQYHIHTNAIAKFSGMICCACKKDSQKSLLKQDAEKYEKEIEELKERIETLENTVVKLVQSDFENDIQYTRLRNNSSEHSVRIEKIEKLVFKSCVIGVEPRDKECCDNKLGKNTFIDNKRACCGIEIEYDWSTSPVSIRYKEDKPKHKTYYVNVYHHKTKGGFRAGDIFYSYEEAILQKDFVHEYIKTISFVID